MTLGWLNTGGVTDGTLPAFHLLEPYGFVAEDMPDLTGKVALVTGTSSGLGLGVSRALAKAGATLTITARTSSKCEAALADVRGHAGTGSSDRVSCKVLELLDLQAVEQSGTELAAALPRLDMLVLNAGIMAPPTLLVSKDGFEEQFQVNHLSQFSLLQKLLPSLKSAQAPRVVFVSSVAHYFAPHNAGETIMSTEAMLDGANYDQYAWYGWSKLANILTARELARREPSIMSHAVHPGGVQGKLLRYSGLGWSTIDAFESAMYWDIDTAAATVLRPLVQAEFGAPENGNGRYLVPIARERRTSAQGEDAALAEALWEFSTSLLQG